MVQYGKISDLNVMVNKKYTSKKITYKKERTLLNYSLAKFVKICTMMFFEECTIIIFRSVYASL
jgi:hypothetical protein